MAVLKLVLKIFSKNNTTYAFCFICSIIFTAYYLFLKSDTSLWNIHQPPEQRDPITHPEYKCCVPLNNTLLENIYFVKTHKTGSSTVQNVVLRFALRHSVDIMNIIYENYYQPFSDRLIIAESKTPNNKYHILASHIRYSRKIQEYQYANTLTVTIMRHPARLFLSLYYYFCLEKNTSMVIEQFVNTPVSRSFFSPSTNTSTSMYRGYNQMSYDLGFDLEKNVDNQTAIDEFVEKIDREFDFVMITEHMEVSMVLLANLMGWPLEYVSHLKINARPINPNTYKLTAEGELTLTKLNHVDAILYRHFLKKFHNCVRQYGEEKMNRKINRLRELNKNLKQRCVAEETVGHTIKYLPKNTPDLECVYATTKEPLLKNIVMDKQFKKYQHSEKK